MRSPHVDVAPVGNGSLAVPNVSSPPLGTPVTVSLSPVRQFVGAHGSTSNTVDVLFIFDVRRFTVILAPRLREYWCGAAKRLGHVPEPICRSQSSVTVETQSSVDAEFSGKQIFDAADGHSARQMHRGHVRHRRLK